MTYLAALAAAIRNAVPPDKLPREDTSGLFLLYAVLLLVKGQAVSREDVHNAWVAWMVGKGESHESMVPFADLPHKAQAEDSPFVAAIQKVAADREGRL